MPERARSPGAVARPGPGRDILGVDEAGRGSLVGPLVVGGFLVPEERLEELPRIGVRDSKLLSASRREALYSELGAIGRRIALHIPVSEVDRAVARRGLNRLEARAFAAIVRETDPAVAYVDACDPVAARFGRTVAALAGGRARILAFHRADRDYPVVGAASIVAKVERDRAVAALAATHGLELGSGYPADPRTVACVQATWRDGSRTPSWIRRSWRTAARLKPRVPLARWDGPDP